jgi:hypothetical protein
MARLTVHKKVFWREGSAERTGKVKLIMASHVVVKAADGCEHIINKNAVYMKKGNRG